MSARAAPSPRLLQPYSPRRPSPLGFPPLGFTPLAPHVAFQSVSYPATPQRAIQPKGVPETRVPFPPEARRPLAGTQRLSHPPPAALTLDTQFHPPTQPPQPHPGTTQPQPQAQPESKQEMSLHVSPPSPTPSTTSSLSLYSADSVTKNFPINVEQEQERRQQQGEEEKPPGVFCGCLNFKAWFGSKAKAKEKRILGPQAPVPAPPAQMVQVRRRPPPLNI